MRCDLRYKSRLSYTLVEVMVALSCGSILLIGGLDLFMEALQATSRSNAAIASTTTGTIAVARIVDMARECYSLSLPTDSSGFIAPVTATTSANYITSDGSAAAIQLTAPGTAAVTVVNSAGVNKTSGTDFPITYARSAGSTLTIYRSDSSGNPSPDTGRYLWEIGTPPGMPVLPASGRALEILADTQALANSTADAITFARDPTSTSTAPAVDIHVVVTNYSAINKQQSNESATNTVIGKCVLLRNHA